MTKQTIVTFIALSVLSTPLLVRAQTKEPNAKMGQPIEAYDLGEGFLATLKRDPDQRVSEIIVERRNLDGGRLNCNVAISEREALALIDELVPEALRGPKDQFYGFESGTGMAATHVYSYAGVDIVVASSLELKGCQKAMLVIKPKAGVWLPW